MKISILAAGLLCGMSCAAIGGSVRDVPARGEPCVRRVGVVNWDCSVPGWTFFGASVTNVLGPAKWRDRTPYYADVTGKDRIEYRFRTLAEYEQEMRYAIEAGIDYFAYCWYDLNPPPEKSVCHEHLQEITYARLHHAKSPLREKLSMCALLVTWHPYSDQELLTLALETREPWYEKVEGRPLVYMFGSAKTAAPKLRELCRRVGAADPYVVMMYSDTPPFKPGECDGADAISAYGCTEYEPVTADYVNMCVMRNAMRMLSGLPVVPHFSTGWNPRPRMERKAPWAHYPDRPWAGDLTAADWLDEAVKLRTWIARNPKACPTGHVMAFAWNEFEEGGWICPTVGADGRPDTTRLGWFRKVVQTLKSPVLRTGKALARHDYFLPEALESADMEGLEADIARALSRSDRTFDLAEKVAAGLTGHERTAVEKRIEIARRLKHYVARRACAPERDELILAWQGAMDLENLYDYFQREAKRAEARKQAPAPQTLNVRAFGATGDGRTDDGPAIRAAFAAAAACKGAPTVVLLPAGTYRVGADPRSPFKDFTLHDWQTGDNRGDTPYWSWSSTSLHLFLHNLDNVTVRGEGPKTKIVFTDSTKGGFGLYGCSGCTIEDMEVDYPDNPSTQGTIAAVETEPFALVFRRQAGYPDPDSPRFLQAKSRYFSPIGADGRYLPRGVGRMGSVERMAEDGLFWFKPLPQHADNPLWRSMKAGDRIALVARYAENSANPVKAQWSAFCTVRNVRFLDSPGQVFWFSGCYAYAITGCRATGRDGSDDWVAGNADAILGSGLIGPYVSDCVFSGLEDDGINISSNTGEITSVPESRRLAQCRTNGSQPAAGGFVSDGVDGRIKMFFRYGKDDRMTRPMPDTVVSAQDLRDSADAKKAWFDRVGAQRRGVRRSDKNIRIPNTTGAVLRNTEFSNLRGRGIQVHCGNMLIENVNVHDVTGVGISIHALLSWSMCYDIYNILVRNCTFARLGGGYGVSTHPEELVPEDPIVHRMHFDIELENCRIDPGDGKPGAFVANADEVTFRNCTFGPGCSNPPVRTRHATRMENR